VVSLAALKSCATTALPVAQAFTIRGAIKNFEFGIQNSGHAFLIPNSKFLISEHTPGPAQTTTATTTAEARPSFSEWLAGVRAEALSRGVRQEIVDEALSNIDEPMPVILERDRAQAETVFALVLAAYK